MRMRSWMASRSAHSLHGDCASASQLNGRTVRYLENAYPENRINYNFFTALPMGDIWRRMATDSCVQFLWDREGLNAGIALIRRLGGNLARIVRSPKHPISDPELFNRGPILEMSIMAYRQLTLGRRNNGWPCRAVRAPHQLG